QIDGAQDIERRRGAEIGRQTLVLGPTGKSGCDDYADDAGNRHGTACKLQAVSRDGEEHEQDRAQQGDGWPDMKCELVALGGAVREAEEVVEPPVVGERPGEP